MLKLSISKKVVSLMLPALLVAAGCDRDTSEDTALHDTESLAPVTAAVTGALATPDPLARAAILASILQGLGPDAVGHVRDAYDAIPGGAQNAGDVELALLVEWWSRHDPAGAFGWIRTRGRHPDPALMRSLVRAWAAQDPEAARAVTESVRVARGSDELIVALVQGWFASDRDGVVEYLAQYPAGSARQFAIAGLLRTMALRDGLDAMFSWAESLPDDAPARFKLQTFRRVGSVAAEIDPLRAAAWAETHLQGDFREGLPRRVAVRWVRQDPEAAMAWLASLPTEGHIEYAVEETYRTWLGRDREGAWAWIRNAEPAPYLEPAVSLYAVGISKEDPLEGIEWAARVLDEDRHDVTLEAIGRAWLNRDPEPARAWIEQSDMSEAARNRVLNPPKRARPGSRANAPAQSPASSEASLGTDDPTAEGSNSQEGR